MGVRFPTSFTSTFLGPFPANATETVILVLGPIAASIDGGPIHMFWSCGAIAGTGVTNYNLKIRRGSTTGGTDITSGGITYPATAAAALVMAGCITDLPGVVAEQQYALTMIQTGATAASTPGQFAFIAMAL